MGKKELTCIGCPMGCTLLVELCEDGEIKVLGNSCKIGEVYAVKECTNPTRIVTTTVLVSDGIYPTVSVKTERDISKSKIFDCIKELKNIVIEAPVHIGDVIYEDILNTGINIVATRNIKKQLL
jgi:CxxC motif-containing protein